MVNGKCSNIGNCSLADSGELQSLPAVAVLRCRICNAGLIQLSPATPDSLPWKQIVIGLLCALTLFLAGRIASQALLQAERRAAAMKTVPRPVAEDAEKFVRKISRDFLE